MKISFSFENLKKNRLLLIWANLLFFAILIVIAYSNIFAKPLASYYADETIFSEIKKSRNESQKSLVDKIYFNNNKLFKDELSQNWYYSIVEGDKNAYTPKINFFSKQGVRVYVLNEEFSSKSVLENKHIKLIAYDKKNYNTFEIIPTTLPLMNVTEDKVYIFDNRKNVSQRSYTLTSNWRYRGRMSMDYPKKGLRIKLRTYSLGNHLRKSERSLFGMSAKSDYNLYANYTDLTKVKQVFGSELWSNCCSMNNSFDIKNGYESRFLELFLGNCYYGLYSITYPVSKEMMNLHENEFLYKKRYFYDEYEVKGGDLRKQKDAIKYIVDFQNIFIPQNTKYSNEFLYNVTDIKNSVDMWLFVNFVQGWDQARGYDVSNHFLTRKKSNKGYKMLYTPWDFDFTWGDCWGRGEKNNVKNNVYKYDENFIMRSNVVYLLLELNDPKIKELIKKRYNELRKTSWSDETLNNMLDNYEEKVIYSGAYYRDLKRWPNSTYADNPKYIMNEFRKYVLKRAHYTDIFIEKITTPSSKVSDWMYPGIYTNVYTNLF